MKIKICGITNIEDALDATALGASALGFIFSESPRKVSPEVVKNIISKLPPFICTVGVFVNEDINWINKVADECNLSMVQLHGNESPDECKQIIKPKLKAIRILGPQDLEIIEKYQNTVSGILLDTYVHNAHGGTGQTFDWGIANEAKKYNIPIIVAGGITPDNICQAIQTASPYGIDLSSGVESSPGKKDYDKLQRLFSNMCVI